MNLTHHIGARMNQRAIRKDLIHLAIELGEQDGDRYQLTQKLIDEHIQSLQQKIRALTDARKKGGVAVVVDGAEAITTYRIDRNTRRSSKKMQGVTFTQ